MMNGCRTYLLLGWFALLALVTTVRATTVIAPDFNRLVDSSDYIVRAVVLSVVSEWHTPPNQPGDRYIRTNVTLDVLEVIKGTPPSPLVLTHLGGRVGEDEFTVDGAPKFTVGQESILFVKGNGRQISPLVGMMHGFYPIRRDKATGHSQVMRSNGQPLYNEQEVSLPPTTASSTLSRNPQARPMTSADFAARIRLARKTPDREHLE